MKNKRFALIGAAGYIAPRHFEAIRANGGELVAVCDVSDSVGIIDRYNQNALYFKEVERFDRYLDKLKRSNPIDFLVVCTPNYLHDSHIRIGLRNGCDVICEKPLVGNARNIEALLEIEKETGRKVYSILQLRLHEQILTIQKELEGRTSSKVKLEYITSRGKWYDYSWKGDIEKSGGILLNIGIHFFDVLLFIFGEPLGINSKTYSDRSASGIIRFQNATVDWHLSIDKADLPINHFPTYRLFSFDEYEIEFSEGFTELHNKSYEEILKGNGFGLVEAKKSIELVNKLQFENGIK